MACGLRLNEAEAFRQLTRDQVAQADVVDQSDQTDAIERGLRRHPLRHVAGDHHDLGLAIAAPGFVGQFDRIARAAQVVAAALVHQRIAPKAFGQLRAAGLAHQFDVIDVGRTVRPLKGAGQRGCGLALVEAQPGDRLVRQLDAERFDLRGEPIPIVEQPLQGRHDMSGLGVPGEIVGDHDQSPVAALGK